MTQVWRSHSLWCVALVCASYLWSPAAPGLGSNINGAAVCPAPCPAGQTCSNGLCIPIAACVSDDDCSLDTRCERGVGCVGWAVQPPPLHAMCGVPTTPAGVYRPTLACEFAAAPLGDPFPGHVDVQATPIVFEVIRPGQVPERQTFIAATFSQTLVNNYTEDLGVIRVLDGSTCEQLAALGGSDVDSPPDGVVDWLVSTATLAAGDIDGDGVAEIVAYAADGSTLAFRYSSGQWQQAALWKAPYPPGAPWAPCNTINHRCALGWAGASIHDLDDDGTAEVVREGVVFSNSGGLQSMQPASYASYAQGLAPVVANLDQDQNVELTNGRFIWQRAGGTWQQEPYFTLAAGTPSHTAVADFGTYGTGLPSSNPEIATVANGVLRVYAATGEQIQFVALPGGTAGGPPTISDFDGDGLVEVGVASTTAYSVFDIDCGAIPRQGGTCAAAACEFNGGPCPPGIAWSRNVQDAGSGATGSIAFDFEGDGSSEAVYSDECFTRVFDSGGAALLSVFRSSCTWNESVVVADVDRDNLADLVVPSNKACSPAGSGPACTQLNGSGVDTRFNGQQCDTSSDCGGGTCNSGLCRCTSTAQCCSAGSDSACVAAGVVCAVPDPGTPGAGNTCRSSHPTGRSGISVYSDVNDRWSPTRSIWNQNAYSVTNVGDDGTIPRTSDWADNWRTPGLNSYRSNPAPGQPAPDLTAGPSMDFTCSSAQAILRGVVCNRGSAPQAPGVGIAFRNAASEACRSATTTTLLPGICEEVSCAWDAAPSTAATAADIDVVPDDVALVAECSETNNEGLLYDVFCTRPDLVLADGFEGPP